MAKRTVQYRTRLTVTGERVQILSTNIWIAGKGWVEVHPHGLARILTKTEDVSVIGADT